VITNEENENNEGDVINEENETYVAYEEDETYVAYEEDESIEVNQEIKTYGEKMKLIRLSLYLMNRERKIWEELIRRNIRRY